MPPRYAYWTILVGNAPTAFRARDADDLRPTLQRLRERHADVVMKWFARGRLWDSPDEARGVSPQVPERPREWRPGGEHRDPRDRFKGARKKDARKKDARSTRPLPRGTPDDADRGGPKSRAPSSRPFARPRGRVPNANRDRDSRGPGSAKPPHSGSKSGRRPAPHGGSGSRPRSGPRPARRPGPKRGRR